MNSEVIFKTYPRIRQHFPQRSLLMHAVAKSSLTTWMIFLKEMCILEIFVGEIRLR